MMWMCNARTFSQKHTACLASGVCDGPASETSDCPRPRLVVAFARGGASPQSLGW